jgi:hypothetical protein
MRQEATARVVQPNEGEQLELRNGQAVIKVDPTMGSPRLAMGTQELRAGAGVRFTRMKMRMKSYSFMEARASLSSATNASISRRAQPFTCPQESCMASRIRAKACNSFGSSPPLVWRISFVKQAGRPV